MRHKRTIPMKQFTFNWLKNHKENSSQDTWDKDDGQNRHDLRLGDLTSWNCHNSGNFDISSWQLYNNIPKLIAVCPSNISLDCLCGYAFRIQWFIKWGFKKVSYSPPIICHSIMVNVLWPSHLIFDVYILCPIVYWWILFFKLSYPTWYGFVIRYQLIWTFSHLWPLTWNRSIYLESSLWAPSSLWFCLFSLL